MSDQNISRWENNNFGKKDYFELDYCPLRPDEIDSRYFEINGEPKNRLLEKINELKGAVGEFGFQDKKFEIYVVGGVSTKGQKNKYNGDLDLYIHNPSQEETLIKYDESKNNLVNKLLLRINSSFPDAEGRKKDGFTDLMISKYPPWGQLYTYPDDQRVVFNASHNKWVLIKFN